MLLKSKFFIVRYSDTITMDAKYNSALKYTKTFK
jgi:hypothetical protein